MDAEARRYIEEAIRRIESGKVKSQEGSHVAGVFGKAAQLYEESMRDKLRQVLDGCGIDYDRELRPEIQGQVRFAKLTLGMIAFCLKKVANMSNSSLGPYFIANTDFRKFHRELEAVNNRWVDVKHGGGIDAAQAVIQLNNMIKTLNTLQP
jgi:hypothetical protein